jgi:hypothetical protein
MDRNVLTELAELNNHLDNAMALLKGFSRFEALNSNDLAGMQAILREQAAEANLMIFETLTTQEEDELEVAFKIRIAADKKRIDPDDCYFDVARREEERRAQGLPSLIGILRGKQPNAPGSGLLDDTKDDEGSEEMCQQGSCDGCVGHEATQIEAEVQFERKCRS